MRVRREIDDARIFHLAGGVHATAEPDATLNLGFDGVAVGEGEHVIGDLIAFWLDGERAAAVLGLRMSGGVDPLRPARRVESLDEFPPFAPKMPRVNPIEITRGCIYACSFCQTPFMFKARFRHRPVADVVRHVEFMYSRGVRDIRFITPTALSYGSKDKEVDLDAVGRLLSAVRMAIGSHGRLFFGTFPSEVRPEHVTREAVHLIRRYADNNNLVIGGQSGSNSVLSRIRRGHDTGAVETAVRCCVEGGLIPNVDFIFGLPHERDDDLQQSLHFAEHLADLGARIHGHTFMPLPGTPLKNARPGTLSVAVTQRIDKLISRGKLYGDWRRQIRQAEQLSELRARSV